MNNFIESTTYRCRKCDKIYKTRPSKCSCDDALSPDKVIGSFKLIEAIPETDNWHVICLLCDVDTEIHRSNIKRQKSCGCKPKHISVLGVSENAVKYLCTKCTSIKNVRIPVLEWCCDVD